MSRSSRWEQLLAKIPVAQTAPQTSDAQYSFRTICNYVSGIAECIRDEFGYDFAAAVATAMQTRITKNLAQSIVALSDGEKNALVRGWSTEALLRQPLNESSLLQPSVHWAPVQAYYAVHGTSSAWIGAGANTTLTHANHLRSISSHLAPSKSLPASIRIHAVSESPAIVRGAPSGQLTLGPASGTLIAPDKNSCHEVAARGLIFARRRHLEELRVDWLRKNKRKKLPAGKYRDLDAGLQPTTIYDFLYRLRLRANYDDAEPFLSGGLSTNDSHRFLADLATIVAFLNFVAEFHIAARVGSGALAALVPGAAGLIAGNLVSVWQTGRLIGPDDSGAGTFPASGR